MPAISQFAGRWFPYEKAKGGLPRGRFRELMEQDAEAFREKIERGFETFDLRYHAAPCGAIGLRHRLSRALEKDRQRKQ